MTRTTTKGLREPRTPKYLQSLLYLRYREGFLPRLQKHRGDLLLRTILREPQHNSCPRTHRGRYIRTVDQLT